VIEDKIKVVANEIAERFRYLMGEAEKIKGRGHMGAVSIGEIEKAENYFYLALSSISQAEYWLDK